MNSKAKKICLLAVMLVILATILTACQLNDTLDDKLDKYNLKAKITYYANGGTVNGNNALDSAELYYKEGDKVFNAGIDEKTDGTFSVTRENYSFIGWYYPQKNGDGSLKYNAKTNLVELGEAFDFKNYVAKSGDEIELYAKWAKNQSIKYVLASETLIDNKLVYEDSNKNTITKYAYRKIADDEDENEYENAYVIKSEDFGIYEYVSERGKDPLGGTAKNYTFVGYYSDAECKTPVKWPIYRTDAEEDIVVYAKYLPSEWTVIKTRDEFAKIFTKTNADSNLTNNGKYYIKDDIDGMGTKIAIKSNTSFKGVIYGNGFTVSNFTFQNIAVGNLEETSIFGNIASEAVIKDITLKDIDVNFYASRSANINVYVFANEIDENATISNVALNGVNVKININSGNASWMNRAESCPLYNGSGHQGITADNMTLKVIEPKEE